MKLSPAQLYRLAGLHKVVSSGGWLGVCQLNVELLSVWAQTIMQAYLSGSLFLSISPSNSCQRKGTYVPSVFRMICVSGLCMTQPAEPNLVAGRQYGNSVSCEARQDLEL